MEVDHRLGVMFRNNPHTAPFDVNVVTKHAERHVSNVKKKRLEIFVLIILKT